MKNTIYLVLGLVIGFLFAEILRRQKMERLQALEAKEAATTAQYAAYNRAWQQELATLPFEERMDWQLFEAGLKLDGLLGDDTDEET